MAKTKRCSKCGKTKGIRRFRKRGDRNKGPKSQCLMCETKTAAVMYARQIAKNPNYGREVALKARYGITLEKYDQLFEIQGGLCAICKTPEIAKYSMGGAVRRLAVDHNHETGKVRGLLCSACNKALGGFNDNPAILAEAIRYLLTPVVPLS